MAWVLLAGQAFSLGSPKASGCSRAVVHIPAPLEPCEGGGAPTSGSGTHRSAQAQICLAGSKLIQARATNRAAFSGLAVEVPVHKTHVQQWPLLWARLLPSACLVLTEVFTCLSGTARKCSLVHGGVVQPEDIVITLLSFSTFMRRHKKTCKKISWSCFSCIVPTGQHMVRPARGTGGQLQLSPVPLGAEHELRSLLGVTLQQHYCSFERFPVSSNELSWCHSLGFKFGPGYPH